MHYGLWTDLLVHFNTFRSQKINESKVCYRQHVIVRYAQKLLPTYQGKNEADQNQTSRRFLIPIFLKCFK